MLRATRRVDPARGCPHRESLEIYRRTATSLRARAHVRGRIASSPKDTGAVKSARARARARGPIVATRNRVGRGRVSRARTPARADGEGKGGVMLAVLRRRLEMAVRVRDFLRAHRADGIQGGEAAALARLEELLTRAQVLAAQQRAGVLARRGSTEQRAVVRRALQSHLLTYLSAVGRVAAGDNPELGAHFRLPATRATNQAFLTLGRGMLKKATEQKELLVGRGMSEQLLDDLAAALTQFEQ